MSFIKPNVIIDFAILAMLAVAVWYYINKADRGLSIPEIRTIPGMEAILEGVGRAVEMGRGVHYCIGDITRISGEFGPAIIASLNLYRYTVGLCAKYELPLFTSLGIHPEIIPLVEAITEDEYRTAGRPELYDPSRILFYGGSEARRIGRMGTILRENVGLDVEAGVFYTNIGSAVVARQIGAITIGGTYRWVAMYGQAIACDYLLITEEILAAGAKASGDPALMSTVVAEDMGKFVVLALSILNIILGLIKSGALNNILSL